MPAIIMIIMMGALFTLDAADRATSHWEKPITKKEFVKELQPITYKTVYND